MVSSINIRYRNHYLYSNDSAHFPAACKIEAKWMFGHLDINNDGLLSTSELFDLEHDQNERCIKPFIDNCDVDNDVNISTREWCRCFEKTDRPCAAVRRRIKYDLLAKGMHFCNQSKNKNLAWFWNTFLITEQKFKKFLNQCEFSIEICGIATVIWKCQNSIRIPLFTRIGKISEWSHENHFFFR